MGINVKVSVKSNANEFLTRLINKKQRQFTMQAARHLAKEIKEDIWRDKDTQTGKARKRKYDIGGVASDGSSIIVGSRDSENPNIETAKLVDSIRAGKINAMSRASFVTSEVDKDGFDYAWFINDRNQFLQRGYHKQKAQLAELHRLIFTQKNV